MYSARFDRPLLIELLILYPKFVTNVPPKNDPTLKNSPAKFLTPPGIVFIYGILSVIFSKLPPKVVPVNFVDTLLANSLPYVPSNVFAIKFLVACLPIGDVTPHLTVSTTAGIDTAAEPRAAPPIVPSASAFSIYLISSSLPCSRRSSLA
jgi:hypothetical protein